MTTRRGFLGAMLAACAAPAVIKSEVLMPVRTLSVPDQSLILPEMEVRGDSNIWIPSGQQESRIHRPHTLKAGDFITIAGVLGANGLPKIFRIANDGSSDVTITGNISLLTGDGMFDVEELK